MQEAVLNMYSEDVQDVREQVRGEEHLFCNFWITFQDHVHFLFPARFEVPILCRVIRIW